MSTVNFKPPRRTKKPKQTTLPQPSQSTQSLPQEQPYFPPHNPRSSRQTGKTQIRWTKQMIEVMLDVLCEEVALRGKRVDNGIKTESLKAAAVAVNKALGMHVGPENVRSSMKTLRASYLTAKALIDASGFGFTYDSGTRTIAGEEDAWNRYFLAHPEAVPLRGKEFPYYDQLYIIIGNETANGHGGDAGDQEEEIFVVDSPNGTEPDEVEDFVVMEGADTSKSQQAPHTGNFGPSTNESSSSEGPRRLPIPPPIVPLQNKRKKSRLGCIDPSDAEYNKGMMDAVKSLADHFSGPKIDDLTEALSNVLGDDEDMLLEAIDLLGANKALASVFMGLNVKLQRPWLLKKLANAARNV